MRLLPAASPAPQLSLLFFLIPLSALCAILKPPPHSVHTATYPKHLRSGEKEEKEEEEDYPIHPSTQPFSTQPIITTLPSSPNQTTTTPPPLPIIHLLDLRLILTSPHTSQKAFLALERACEAIALWLLDFDLPEEQDLVLRVGAFTLELHEVAEHLSVLAVKAVVMKVLRMVLRGLLGFVEGEVVDVQAGVRMVFAFGVTGVGGEGWGVRRRSTRGEEGVVGRFGG